MSMLPMPDTPYPPTTWRLLVETTPRTGAWNMAVDEAIMEAVAAGNASPTLRFYQWQPPCISLGKRQPLSGVLVDRCREQGIDLVRRSTGGLAILHTDELTYSIVTRLDDPRADGAILDSYRKLSQGLVAGLRLLDVSAQMQPVSPGGTHNASAACFEAPSAYEITAGQYKLMGSAQTRPYGKLLQHGSLPLFGEITRLVDYLAVTDEAQRQALREHLRQRAATLQEVVGRSVSFEQAATALSQGFSTVLALDLIPGELSAEEFVVAERIAATKATIE